MGGDAWEVGGRGGRKGEGREDRGGRKGEESEMGGGDVNLTTSQLALLQN